VDAIRLLLNNGADPELKDMEGRTPAQAIRSAPRYSRETDLELEAEILRLLGDSDPPTPPRPSAQRIGHSAKPKEDRYRPAGRRSSYRR
jgi:hypothetical protein